VTRPLRLLTALVALALLAPACGGDGSGSSTEPGPGSSSVTEEEQRAALASAADEIVVPGYRLLVDRLEALGVTLAGLCARPGADPLAEARAAWRETAREWQATRATAVGPAMDRRLMADVGFAARASSVEDLLEGTDPVDVEGLATTGSAFRGIYAIELLLFGDGADELLTAAGARRCTMATSASRLAARATTAVLDDWTGGYRDRFVAGLDGGPLTSIDALVNQLIAGLTAVDDSGLRDLVAAETLDDVPTTRRDGPGATRMDQHRAVVGAVATVVQGSARKDRGLAELVGERSPGTGDRLRDRARAAAAAMGALPDSVADSFAAREALATAAEAVAALKVLLATEVASQLGITIRFSDADGDS